IGDAEMRDGLDHAEGGDVEDAPEFPLPHPANHHLGDPNQREHHRAELILPYFRLDAERARGRRSTRVVDEDIDGTELADGGVYGRFDGRPIEEIGGDTDRTAAAAGVDFGGGPVQRFARARDQGYVHPLPRKRIGNPPADSLAAAENQSLLSLELQVHRSAPSG